MKDILRGCEFELLNGVNYYPHSYVVDLEKKLAEAKRDYSDLKDLYQDAIGKRMEREDKLVIAKEALEDSLELFKQVKDVDMNTGDFMDIDNMEGRIQNALKQINQ